MLLAVALLSFGAPFWFNALKYLVGLRPALAGVEDRQRLERRKPAEPTS